MKKYNILFLLFTIILKSCVKLPSSLKEDWRMGAILQSYERTCFEVPRTADDLINFMELEGGLLDEEVFYAPYEFLKKHRDKIRIVEEEGFTVMFLKNKYITDINTTFNCDNERGLHGEMSFLGSDGLPILGKRYEYCLKELQSRLWPIGYKNRNKAWQKQKGHIFEDPIILEYTKANGLVNVCSKEKIDVESSLFYQDLYDVLEQFSKEYSIPRIILDSYIPKF